MNEEQENIDNNDLDGVTFDEAVQQPAEPQPVAAQESDASKNMRALREKAERIERERDEALRKLQEYELQKTKQAEENEPHVNPDDLVEAKYVDRKIKKLEEQIKHYQQQNAESAIESKLKSQYPDFDSVVSKDNVNLLREQYPELASTLNSTSDLYTKAVSAYTLIKKLGIEPQVDMYEKNRALAQKNSAKPRPLTSVSPQQGESPLSRANAFADELNDELKAQLRKEMYSAMNSR